MRHDESRVQKNASLNSTRTRLMGREEHGVQEIRDRSLNLYLVSFHLEIWPPKDTVIILSFFSN